MLNSPNFAISQKNNIDFENYEQEFYTRTLSLFASMYDEPSTDEMTTFSNNSQVEINSSKNIKLEFNSPLTDHRIRKNIQKMAAQTQFENNRLNLKINEESSDIIQSNINLEEIFAKDKAQRPEKPKYILNEEIDRKIMEDKISHRERSVYTGTELSKRAELAKQRGIEKCMKRKQLIEETKKNSKSPSYTSKMQLRSDANQSPQVKIAESALVYNRRMNYQSPLKCSPK